MATDWTRVESSMGENLELKANASMRAIKAALGITGKRLRIVSRHGQWREYSLCGTPYRFTVTRCN